ncbi:MAG: SigB/SigF/SigG family RNA polymerase sigma factor [Pseudonocardiaceae bacterium]|nr:SigB/SigF/SigG family RNA polymerase sigma factor [Pseudonocardiaceae bacterium]
MASDVPDYQAFAPLFTEFVSLPADDPRRAKLRDELVAGHLPVARHIARRFAHRGEPQDDLEQVAILGLIQAVDRYQPDRGSDFLSFAVPTITGEVRRHFRDHAWAMRVPRRLKDLHVSLGTAISELSQRVGRAPTATELARHLDLPREEIFEGLEAASAYRSSSLDDLLTADQDTAALEGVVGEADAELDRVEYRTTLAPLLEQLSDRERAILKLRFFGGMTQSQIAQQIGLSQMHVSRLLSRTLARLRSELRDET